MFGAWARGRTSSRGQPFGFGPVLPSDQRHGATSSRRELAEGGGAKFASCWAFSSRPIVSRFSS